jgi:hypothetical protein
VEAASELGRHELGVTLEAPQVVQVNMLAVLHLGGRRKVDDPHRAARAAEEHVCRRERVVNEVRAVQVVQSPEQRGAQRNHLSGGQRRGRARPWLGVHVLVDCLNGRVRRRRERQGPQHARQPVLPQPLAFALTRSSGWRGAADARRDEALNDEVAGGICRVWLAEERAPRPAHQRACPFGGVRLRHCGRQTVFAYRTPERYVSYDKAVVTRIPCHSDALT